MEELFEKTDYEIELYIEDAMHQDTVFRHSSLDPDSMDNWFQKRKQRIYDMFHKWQPQAPCSKSTENMKIITFTSSGALWNLTNQHLRKEKKSL